MRSFPIAASLCLFLTACGPAAPPEQRNAAEPAEVPANTRIEQDVANIQASVVRTSDAQRLDELERRISRLETTPEKLDLELLGSRVQALEVKAGVDSLATPVAVPGATPSSAQPSSAQLSPTKSSPTKASPAKRPTPRPRPSPTAIATAKPAAEN